MCQSLKIIYIISNSYCAKYNHSDITLSLALTHHLLLGQGYSINYIFDKIGEVTNKYVFIEFMPKSLWPLEANPPIPEWHTVEWFKENFVNYFGLIHEKDLGDNRYLFIGKVNKELNWTLDINYQNKP